MDMRKSIRSPLSDFYHIGADKPESGSRRGSQPLLDVQPSSLDQSLALAAVLHVLRRRRVGGLESVVQMLAGQQHAAGQRVHVEL